MVKSVEPDTTADLGDLVVVLLAGTLSGLRDRLWDDGFQRAADLVADLVIRCDVYIEKEAGCNGS
jgi:hypothetical protein